MCTERELLTPLSLTLSALDPAQESHAGVRIVGELLKVLRSFLHTQRQRESRSQPVRTYIQYTKEREEALSHSLTHVIGCASIVRTGTSIQALLCIAPRRSTRVSVCSFAHVAIVAAPLV